MKNNLLSILLSTITACSLASLPAFAAEKHVHGEAELFIVVVEQQIMIEMESPADNIVGFEHAPQTQEQKDRVASSLKTLNEYQHLVELTTKAGCTQTEASVESPFDTHKKHDDHHHGHNHHHDESGHSAFFIRYTLNCQNTGSIEQLEVTAFKHFKGFEKITVNWVNNNQQGSQRTTPSSPAVSLL